MSFQTKFRIGLTAKTVIVTTLVALVVIGGMVLTSRAFERLQNALNDLSSTQLEQLMTSVRLVQQTESLASLGLILAQAQNHDARRRTLIELNDRTGWMGKLSRELGSVAADKEVIERVNIKRQALSQNIEELNVLVSERIDGPKQAALERKIRLHSAKNQELAGELSITMGYFAASRRSQLASQSAQLAQDVNRHQQTLMLLTAFLLLSVLLSGVYFERRLVRRILRLQRAVAKATVHPADLQLDGSDELAHLATTVGTYVQRIQAQEFQMRQANDELAFLAEHDPLTKLANRRHFDAAAHRLLQQSALPLCVVVCDIDHFKHVNDAHGHAVGDQALVHLALQLQSCMRGNDILARFGGEEFAAILPVHTPLEAGEIVERIRQKIASNPLHTEEIMSLPLTLSYGLVLVDNLPLASDVDVKHGRTLLSLALRMADDALFAAKHAGRDRICFSETTLHADAFDKDYSP